MIGLVMKDAILPVLHCVADHSKDLSRIITQESEFTVDLQAETYVSNILPDPASIVFAERGSVLAALGNDNAHGCWEEPPNPPPQRHRGGRTPRPTTVRQRMAVDGDECVVCEAQSGRWSSLQPVGTVVRRPSVKLVQLVAQAIHESPHGVLRITHVYAALLNRYPYFRPQDKKGISSWKPATSAMYAAVNGPRKWQMPRGLQKPFLPTDDEGEQRNDEASTLLSAHLNTELPSETTTALLPSAFRVELEHELFPPPEPQSPGRKRKLSAVQFAPVTSAPQSVDDLASVGSPPSSLPHIAPADSWKSESMNPVGWPGRGEEQAWQQPNVGACAAPPNLWGVVYRKRIAVNESGHITLKVANQSRCTYIFKVWKNKPLRRLMRVYCRPETVTFRFDGHLIKETETPAGLDMENEDTIDVFQ
ncbi:hypothetical protein HPB49_026236 [Dermacentor silvarum]|nr:hypothetical protein HPB49_026236 [Dermacentor silvarum]